MNKEELFDKIERYLNNGLDDREKQLFEEQLNADTSLRKEVALHRELRDTINHQSEKDRFLDNLGTVHKEFTGSPDTHDTGASFRKKYYWAAVLALAVVCGYIFYKVVVDRPGSDELFTAYFAPYENFITSRGNDDTSLTQAMLFYDKADHQNAINYFEQLTDINDPAVSLYYGISLMQEDRFAMAEEKLKFTIEKGAPLITPVAQWYLALLHLKTGNIPQAKSLLSHIIEDPGSEFYDSAKALLNDLH